MKLSSATLPSALVLVLLAGAACKSSTADQGAAAGKNITKAAEGIERGIAELDATVSSLNALVNQPAADLGPQYKAFAKNLENLESTAKTVAKVSAEMSAKGKEYFTKWDEQIAAIQNEDIRERSAERREKVSKALSEIQEQYAEAKEEFKPLLSDLQDINTALEVELTMDSLEGLKDNVEKVTDSADDAKETLQELAQNFRDLGVRLSKAGPAPAEATAK